MTALPLKTTNSPHAAIDDLIADFGIRPVLIAFVARLFRRKPQIVPNVPETGRPPRVDGLNNHLRADLGLPPEDSNVRGIEQLLLRGPLL